MVLFIREGKFSVNSSFVLESEGKIGLPVGT